MKKLPKSLMPALDYVTTQHANATFDHESGVSTLIKLCISCVLEFLVTRSCESLQKSYQRETNGNSDFMLQLLGHPSHFSLAFVLRPGQALMK